MGAGSSGGVTVEWCAATDVGRVRSVNEDSVLADLPVFVVADGMGGHEAGDVASRLVVDEFSRLSDGPLSQPEEVAEVIDRANRAIVDHSIRHPGCSGMGTTAVGLLLVEHSGAPSWLVFNVGDSRAYRLADHRLEQLSVDHSYVQELVDSGEITPLAARVHPQRNVVTRALGVDSGVEPDLWLRSPAAGERFLLCSDGLSGELDDATIAEVLSTSVSADAAARELVRRALEAGGHDNVTVLVLDVVDVADGEVGEDTAPRGLIRELGLAADAGPDGAASRDGADDPVDGLIGHDEVLAIAVPADGPSGARVADGVGEPVGGLLIDVVPDQAELPEVEAPPTIEFELPPEPNGAAGAANAADAAPVSGAGSDRGVDVDAGGGAGTEFELAGDDGAGPDAVLEAGSDETDHPAAEPGGADGAIVGDDPDDEAGGTGQEEAPRG